MLKLLKQIFAYNRNKKLFDSIGEGTWELPSYLHFLSISCKWRRYHNRYAARVRTWSIYSHGSKAGPAERLERIGYFKTSILEYDLKIYSPWCMAQQSGTYGMNYENTQI